MATKPVAVPPNSLQIKPNLQGISRTKNPIIVDISKLEGTPIANADPKSPLVRTRDMDEAASCASIALLPDVNLLHQLPHCTARHSRAKESRPLRSIVSKHCKMISLRYSCDAIVQADVAPPICIMATRIDFNCSLVKDDALCLAIQSCAFIKYRSVCVPK